MKSINLNSNNLFHKWGFGDGDVLYDWWWDNYDDSPPVDKHDLLYDLVVRYLVPELEKAGHTLDVIRIHTNHNPVRAETLDGVEVDWYSETWELIEPEISVEITEVQIKEAVDSLGG